MSKKFLKFSILFLIFVFLFFPLESFAQTKKIIGQECSKNEDCQSGDCESGKNIPIEKTDYCVCNDDNDCKEAYGGEGTWYCKDGIEKSFDLHYCQNSQTGNKYPLTLDDIKTKQAAEDAAIAAKLGTPPQLHSLGEVCNLKQVKVQIGQMGLFPWVGQCLGGIYKYIFVIGTVIIILIILIGGLTYITSGAMPTKANTGKTMIKTGLLGLIMMMSTYLVANLINPELTKFKVIQLETVKPVKFEHIDLEPTNYPSNWPEGPNITADFENINEVNNNAFTTTTINQQNSNGFNIWNSLNESQKKEVLPYLKKQIASCQQNEAIKEWENIQIHSSVVPALQKAQEIAKNFGLKLHFNDGYRTTEKQIKLWNTGIVARYKQGKTNWQNNEDMISFPSCTKSPHLTGGAVDVLLISSDGKQLTDTNAKQKIETISDFDTYFGSNIYKVMLENIMNQAGFVRYCREHWHFEYGLTERYKIWEKNGKKTRCWGTSNAIEGVLSENIKNQANEITCKGPKKEKMFPDGKPCEN